METKVEIRDSITYVEVIGSINSENANAFEVSLKDFPGDTKGIVIDAHALEYLSSAGLRVLLSLKKRCKEKDFRIVGVNSEVMNIVEQHNKIHKYGNSIQNKYEKYRKYLTNI